VKYADLVPELPGTEARVPRCGSPLTVFAPRPFGSIVAGCIRWVRLTGQDSTRRLIRGWISEREASRSRCSVVMSACPICPSTRDALGPACAESVTNVRRSVCGVIAGGSTASPRAARASRRPRRRAPACDGCDCVLSAACQAWFPNGRSSAPDDLCSAR